MSDATSFGGWTRLRLSHKSGRRSAGAFRRD
jgi:hypothetical protein